MMRFLPALAVALFASLSTQAEALAPGDTVTCTATGYTCNQSSATVGSGVEFTINQPGFLVSMPAFSADFSAGVLTLTSLLSATNLGSYVIRFADVTNPITSASLSSITGVSTGFSTSDVSVSPAGLLSLDFSNTIIVPTTTYRIAVNQAAAPAAVPETGTWLMMLAGFGAIGAALRRRRSAPLAHA